MLKLWQGLGYYSRARNLHTTAKYVANELGGVFPDNYIGLLRLKGVGDYTASAIASICFNEKAAVVDGNVYRVLSRVFDVDTPINSSVGIKEFKKLAQALIPDSDPATYNQAIMEFGARYCVPQNPNCSACIFSAKCVAHRDKKVKLLPVKLKKTKVKELYFDFIVGLGVSNTTFVEQRTGKGIWQNLFQFPLVEGEVQLSPSELKKVPAYVKISEELGLNSLVLYNETPIVHKLSHRTLHTRFWIAKTEDSAVEGISYQDLKRLPVPVLIGNFISEFAPFKS